MYIEKIKPTNYGVDATAWFLAGVAISPVNNRAIMSFSGYYTEKGMLDKKQPLAGDNITLSDLLYAELMTGPVTEKRCLDIAIQTPNFAGGIIKE